MSSIATFYILPEAKRAEFTDAHRNQKRVTYKRTLFGQKEVVTGERFLWEYLDAASTDRTDFPFSGFAFIDYFFTFVTSTLPKDMESALAGAAVDEHHYAFSAELAASFAEYLRLHPPESAGFSAFAAEHNPSGGAEYVQILRETHDFLVRWFGRIATGTFGVLHITF
ncbi:MAG: hypothetical protein HZA92_03500 [Verrucomicrobia bacterium]|nr:hypothetical protein [Verrucomicrobiota bacterium]